MVEMVCIPSLEGMEHVKAENRVILTKPFLMSASKSCLSWVTHLLRCQLHINLEFLIVANSSVFLYACLGWNMQGTLVLILVLLFS